MSADEDGVSDEASSGATGLIVGAFLGLLPAVFFEDLLKNTRNSN